ncbi:MAG: ATP-binding protein [Pseudomonadota bacterium]
MSEQQAPIVVEVGLDACIVSVTGDQGGLPAHQAGDNVFDVWPFLIGQDLVSMFALPMVNLSDDQVFHIHGVPDDDRSYLVFLPAHDERDYRLELQQKANEVRLLSHRQQRLVEQLSAAKADLESREKDLLRANNIKARFIAGMSHEFRTPLASILGYAELIELASESLHDASDEVATHVQSISRAGRHLLSMVDNILDQARLEDDQLVLQEKPVSLRGLVDDMSAIVAPLAAARFLAYASFVDPDVPDVVMIDATRLRQVLLNLLGNAIKFTEHGSVSLEVGCAGDELVLAVSDTGLGIAPSDRAHIFDAFARGQADEHVGGVGLGLNITKRLCDLMNGRIELASAVGEGSTFTVSLPLAVAAKPESPPATPRARPIGDADVRILVAEDDPDIIDLVQIILAGAGYRVDVAMNGQDAVDMCGQTKPDLVLMDVNMPILNGLEAATAMRQRGLTVPIIALSASLGLADRDDALRAGYDAYLLKPIARTDLLASIARHLEGVPS